jgi:Putative serine esterase (DUF676)
MWSLIERAAGALMNARYARLHDEQMPHYHRPRLGTDTVVFVHGLHGHILETWGRFPALLADDPEIPSVDILMWGYRATVFPGAQSIASVGESLMGFVREQTDDGADIFFVGHSLGGLLILRGLCDEARAGRARQRPAQATRHVHLYASPTEGTEVAGAIRATVAVVPRLGHFIAGHLRELARGTFCDQLIADVVEHLYRPRIDPGDENRKVEVAIKACVAARDIAVRESSARAIFQHPPPILIQGATHVSIKEPESHRDVRYLAFRESLIPHYREWFQEISRRVLDNNDPVARAEIRERGWAPAVMRLERSRPLTGSSVSDDRVEELLAVAMQLARAAPTLRFGRALDVALVELLRRGR